MTEITLNILEDDRKLTNFIIDYFNITDIKITNGKFIDGTLNQNLIVVLINIIRTY